MSDHEDMRGPGPAWENAHALSGAYAVDALDDVERARFEQHLLGCPDCRLEVAAFRDTAAALSADEVAPPPSLRASVLAGIEEIRPLPPLTEHGRDRVVSIESRRRPWLRGAGPLLVAAALVLVAMVATVAVRPWADDTETQQTATEQVLTDPAADHFPARLDDGTKVTVVVSQTHRRAVVLTKDMPLAPEGKVFELWLQTADGIMEPAGLMPDENDATVLLDGDPTDATAVGITIEPDGGSSEPSPDVVAVVDITSA